MSRKRPSEVHCNIRVCSFTPLVAGNSRGDLYVKYYALGRTKGESQCLCSIHEWRDLVEAGRIVRANNRLDESHEKQ